MKFIELCHQVVDWLRTPFFCLPSRRSFHSPSQNNEGYQEMIALSSQENLFIEPNNADSTLQVQEQDTKASLNTLNDLTKSHILQFLAIQDLENVQYVNKSFYRLVHQSEFLCYYANTKYGRFFKPQQDVKLAIKALNFFYQAWDKIKLSTASKEKKLETQHLFTGAFIQFKTLFDKQNHEWTSLYLAIMLHNGYGIERNNAEVKKYVEVLKNMWGKLPNNAELKNEENLKALAHVVLENYYASKTKDPTDIQFYEQHLSVLRPT